MFKFNPITGKLDYFEKSADTLQSVTDRGSTTTQTITATGFIGDGTLLTGILRFTYFV